MGIFSKSKKVKNREPQSKLYKAVMNTSIIAVFVAVGILVVSLTGLIKMNSFLFGITASIAIVAIAGVLLLPWIRNIEKAEFKKVSIMFIAFIAVCAVLWIVCVFLGVDLYNKAKTESADSDALFATLNFVKIVLIISLQMIMTSLIANTIIKYRKKMVAFQVITYLSNLFFDFYVTYLLCCISISSDGFSVSEAISLLGNKIMITLIGLSVIYMALSSKIMQVVEEKKHRYAIDDSYNVDGTRKFETSDENADIEAKLEKLKNMLDKNLISQEEYDSKKQEILKDL